MLITLFSKIFLVIGYDQDTYTKVLNAANIMVGTSFIQKISSFHINDSNITCTDRYLPILFRMINDKSEDVEVKGLLTEYGNLVKDQEKINCRLFKK